MCSRCEELEARIRTLEIELSECVRVEPTDRRKIQKATGLSRQCAEIVAALYRSKVPVSVTELNDGLPLARDSKRGDPEFRTTASIRTQMNRLRKITPGLLPPPAPGRGAGYSLSIEGRKIVKAALDA